MQNWRFNTDVIPNALRNDAWTEILADLMLKFSPKGKAEAKLSSNGWKCVSTLQSIYAEIHATPQIITPDSGLIRSYLNQGGQAVLVVQLRAGNGYIRTAAEANQFDANHVLIIDPTQNWQLEFLSDFHATFICLKGVSLLLRLLRSIPEGHTLIQKGSGTANAIFALLDSISGSLGDIRPEDLSQIEVALESLLLSTLAQHKGPQVEDLSSSKRSSSTQLSQLKRVCKTIELNLSEPEFSLQHLAEAEKISSRYIQKLFLTIGTTFTQYLKKRRLERCRIDLADPALAHLTILEICDRWGFTDAANFSRAFSQEYQVTPREWRAAPKPQSNAYRGSPAFLKLDDQEEMDWDALAEFHSEGAIGTTLRLASTEQEQEQDKKHHHLAATKKTIHWGYFCKSLKPILTVDSGDFITIETITQHAYDDHALMIKGDPHAEDIFRWDHDGKAINRRGAGPIDGSVYGRGPGEGFGVHICTGPIMIRDAQPDDILEVRILDVAFRPSHAVPGKAYGSNAATWWGYHYRDLITAPKQREVITIYEIEETGFEKFARALYSFRWTPQTDPSGVRHELIDYPGIPVDHSTVEKKLDVLKGVRIPVRPHFGVMAVAPNFEGNVDSVPPGSFGGNIDNWRAAPGSSVFLPVQVAGGLFSVGDPHASQGDSEICGTAIECSLTGEFQLVLHKKGSSSQFQDLDFPFIETADEWVILGFSYPNYLVELGATAQSEVYKKSTLDLAMRDAFRKTRKFLMVAKGLTEDEAVSLMSVAIDFGLTQIVNGNIGIHAIVRKSLFAERDASA